MPIPENLLNQKFKMSLVKTNNGENEELFNCLVTSSPRMMAVARALNAEARRQDLKVFKVTNKDPDAYLQWSHGTWTSSSKDAQVHYKLLVYLS